MAKEVDQKELEKKLSDIAPTILKHEVADQFRNHQRFLISGLDSDEEYKSRLAFTDAYKKEFQKVHEQLRDMFGLEKGEHEFDYLNNEQFRKTTDGYKSIVFDMMKDYLSYQYQMGHISGEAQKNALAGEPKAEQEFRNRDRLKGNERNFLIDDNNAFSQEKRDGLRDCRKWMYRNCSKSGMMNETGSKRNLIDSFGKRSVAEQINTIFQVERQFYKYKDDKKTGSAEKSAMNEDYIPNLDHFKSKMVRGKVNPYRHWKKVTGDLFYWSRMERALNKTDDAMDQINRAYDQLNTRTEQKKAQEEAAKEHPGENRIDPAEQKKQQLLQQNSDKMQALFDKYNINVYDFFDDWRREYQSKLEKYAEEKTPENYEKLTKVSSEFRDAFDKVKDLPMMNADPKRKASIEAFADFSKQMDKDAEKMSTNQITESWGEWVKAKGDLAITGYSAASGGFSASKAVITMIKGTIDGLEVAANGVSIASAAMSGVTAVKNFAQAGVSGYRQGYVSKIKKKNKTELKESRKELEDLKKQQESLNPNSQEGKENREKIEKAEKKTQDAQTINTMSKVSKSDNKNKKWMYVAAGTTATASCTLGIVGVASTIGMPITIAGIAVAGIGFCGNYVVQQVAGKNPAKKSVDNQMKLEDPDYAAQKDENGKGKRYIDSKVDERKQMVEDKKERFRPGTDNYNNSEYYLNHPGKLKDRIRTNFTVKHNCATMMTYRAANDKENANIAYRHVFLRDPDGPIDEKNLLKPEEVKQFLSTKQEDLERTGQTLEEAKRRINYKDLLDSEGHYTKAPKSVDDAKKRFEAKKEAEKPQRKNVDMSKEAGRSAEEQKIGDTKKDLHNLGNAKQKVDLFAKESEKLLKRLEKAGQGKDKDGYQKLKTALEKASKLNENSKISDVGEVMDEVNRSASAYANSHSGLFQGLIGNGKERLNVSKKARELSAEHINLLRANTRGTDKRNSIQENITEQEKKLTDLKQEKKLTDLKQGKQLMTEEQKREHERKVQEAKDKRYEKELQEKNLQKQGGLKK